MKDFQITTFENSKGVPKIFDKLFQIIIIYEIQLKVYVGAQCFIYIRKLTQVGDPNSRTELEFKKCKFIFFHCDVALFLVKPVKNLQPNLLLNDVLVLTTHR
jgi:hypothetical protein